MKTKNWSKTTRYNFVTYAIVIFAYLAMEIMSSFGVLSNSLRGQLVPICTYIILAISLNLTVGVLGELSLGHAGFMSVGAFAGAFFSVCTEQIIPIAWLRFPLALLIGGITAGVVGIIIGIPVLRLQGDYLAIVTLAFGEIIKNLFNSFYVGIDAGGAHFSLTDVASLGMAPEGKVIINGAMGITGTPKNATFTIGFVLVLMTLFIVLNLMKSRAGRAIMSIRDNRIAAESVGINITKYKMLAFSLSAALAGVAGVLYAHNFSTLVAKKFDYNTSILILVFVVVGGMGNMRGSMIAAAALTVLPEMLRGLNDYRMLIYAIILIGMMIFNQNPKMIEWRKKMRSKMPTFVWKPAKAKKEEK
ncbi:MAG: branched-chain amino acid ABC transporter permease [Ruthenibacterium sp.]